MKSVSVMTTSFEVIDGRKYAVMVSPTTPYIAKVMGQDTDYPEEQRLWYLEVESWDDAVSQVSALNEDYEHWSWRLIFVRKPGSKVLIRSRKAFLKNA